MKKRLKITLIVILSLPAFLALLLGLMTVASYHPVPVEKITGQGRATGPAAGSEFSFFTWNLGYGGLGKKMDFFYEGGKRVRPVKREFNDYFGGILRELKNIDTVDFVFLQEIDRHSKRSYYTDEFAEAGQVLSGYAAFFAKNYDSRFVPVPADDPMGRVVSGLAVYSKYNPDSAFRYDFGTKFSWPKQLFFLQRCFISMKYRLKSGKYLVIINTHNSVFDEKGELRKKELGMIEKYAMHEYRLGNYVVVGGDWNQNPPGWWKEWNKNDPQLKRSYNMREYIPQMSDTIFRGWSFAYDPVIPTNRDVDKPYYEGITKTTTIDFFVVSPNVKVLNVRAVPSGFENSDHQPVWIKIKLL